MQFRAYLAAQAEAQRKSEAQRVEDERREREQELSRQATEYARLLDVQLTEETKLRKRQEHNLLLAKLGTCPSEGRCEACCCHCAPHPCPYHVCPHTPAPDAKTPDTQDAQDHAAHEAEMRRYYDQRRRDYFNEHLIYSGTDADADEIIRSLTNNPDTLQEHE